jgi:hypothetical protein
MSDCNEELNNLYSSPNIVTIKEDGMSRTEHIELMDIDRKFWRENLKERNN